MTGPRPWTRENGTRSPFSWTHRQTDQGVRPYSSTRSPFDGLIGGSRSVGTPFGLRPHSIPTLNKIGEKRPFSHHSKGEPETTREKIHFSGQESSSPRSRIIVVEHSRFHHRDAE